MRVLEIVAARPNFMKMAPIIRALRQHEGVEQLLVHTGQHYDERMSGSFFSEFSLPEPDINLGIGSGSHAEQTGKVMMAIEPVMQDFKPGLVVVVGDVNSTLACALAAKKLALRVAHVESGLRSYDRAMPEEINRLCTDAISDLLFTTDRLADENLIREGVDPAHIHFVGNVMIDTLMAYSADAKRLEYHTRLGLEPGRYGTITLHRPSNVDNRAVLTGILETLTDAAAAMPFVFPIHPRTRKRVEEFGLAHLFSDRPEPGRIFATEPLSYLEFLSLNMNAALVATDSGGLQEETTILGVPCVTLRENTERPITITEGTNRLAGTTRAGIRAAIEDALSQSSREPRRPEKWDGRAAERIADIIVREQAS